jgi:glycosyltransferase involved in cell wall biosynthesis
VKQRKIVIVTTGQPSTNPRMVKEVEAFIGNGFQVKVFYSYWASWGQVADKAILTKYSGVFKEVGGNPSTSRITYFISRLQYKVIRLLCPVFPFLAQFALARTTLALRKAARREKADLYIAHNLGALPAAAIAAKSNKALLGFDAEDFHRGERAVSDPDYKSCCWVEETYLPRCSYITAAAPLIAQAYEELISGIRLTVINNVFSKKFLQQIATHEENTLKLFWFSQTIGANRGLETVIMALNRLEGSRISVCLLGDCSPVYKEQLTRLANDPSAITFMAPVKSDDIFSIAATFDVGLSTEVPHCLNRDFCLTNKLFSYLLAGNCIVASDTSAQSQFLSQNHAVGVLYRHNDADHLAAQLDKLYKDKSYLSQCRQNAVLLAASTYNWEEESRTLLSIIDHILPPVGRSQSSSTLIA